MERSVMRHDRDDKDQRSSPNERRVRALGDRALVDAMRAGDDWAFAEFLSRFRPMLSEYARGRIPPDMFPECIEDVLEDEAIRLLEHEMVMPIQFRSYLIAAVRRRYFNLRRNALRRQRWYEEAAGSGVLTADGQEPIVRSVCAESSIAAADGARDVEPAEPNALEQLARAINFELDAETRQLLDWLSRAIPHRVIATWLGKSYDATTKHIWRLCRRLERAAPIYAATLSPATQRELDRFFRRMDRGRRS
jgi:DNA-directed RNA polymerase specialized sigma24 family protein